MKNKRIINIVFFLGFFVVFGFLMTKVSLAGCPDETNYACSSDGASDCSQFDGTLNEMKWEIYSPDKEACVNWRNDSSSVCCHMVSYRNDCEDKAGGKCENWIGGSDPSEICKNGYLGGYDKWCNTGEYCCKKSGGSPPVEDGCEDKKDGETCTTGEGDAGTCKEKKCVKNPDPNTVNCSDRKNDGVSCKTKDGGDAGTCKEGVCIKSDIPDPENGECKSVEEGVKGGFLFFKGSIVPCGRNCDDPNTEIDEKKTCTLCHFIIMFFNVFEFLISLLVVVALLFITISGVVFLISAGNPGLRTTAKGILTKTLAGFAIALLSWLIIFTLLKFISVRDNDMLGSGGKWNEFKCETDSIFDKYK
jgi:Type IV secretion system pilin